MENITTLPKEDDARWQAVMARDAGFDGAFVYAVETTGIFCRPSCPSRRPGRHRVAFFAVPEAAARAGFRPCKRCRPEDAPGADKTLATVRRLCRIIEEADEGIPTLATLGAQVGLSPHHLQRLFARVMGISPRQYGAALRLGRVKEVLKDGEPVSAALYGAGYGSSSRLYEKAPDHLGMTPVSYAKGGKGAAIAYAIAASPLGRLLVAATERGVCMVSLGDDDAALEKELANDYPAAAIRRDDGALGQRLGAILAHLEGRQPHVQLPLDVRATAFQWQVWQRLCAIPMGETRTYGEIAADLGRPKAARAVGRACATNPVSLVVPCHRAVGADGAVTGYRWGVGRKKALLEREKELAG
ncbi:MAG: bifunctional DNA-binding transcriptional regulator/O6-methylguanine-DNA methyltransferase Ada [Rhodospirillales bacterium]|jgi:AraC family transcriptional regulator of adaptative response/methylated-DNA-[protein]-cysteine methyltransferase|nr:bifunctional DNA-binding transcriptional regulator/O6-methylguanine-DNA methyltransferase Ada [Rhodospirillales bacterium]